MELLLFVNGLDILHPYNCYGYNIFCASTCAAELRGQGAELNREFGRWCTYNSHVAIQSSEFRQFGSCLGHTINK